MKNTLRFSAAVVTALLISACSSSTKSTKGAEDVGSPSKDGCSEVDPFCGKNASDSKDSKDSSGGDEASSDSSSGSSSGASSSNAGASSAGAESSTGFNEFKRVITVAKPKESAAAGDDKKKDGAKPDGAKPAKDAAKPAKAPAKGAKQPAAKDGVTPYKVVLHPKGLSWGMGLEQISKQYERLLDAAYIEVYKKTPVGPQLDSLDAEVKEKKALLRRNQLEFGNLPTGVDNSALNGEYSYLNNESMTKLDLENGVVRNFFFFGNRLWKLYDEHKLGKGSPLGESWDSAVAYLTDQLGTKPKLVAGDAAQGRNYDEAEWRDGTTLVRLVNREASHTVGLVFVDESVQLKLPTLRKNKPQDPSAVESSVRAATAPPPPPPDSKKDAKKDKDKGKKK